MKGAAWLGFFFFVALVLLGFATLLVGDLSALFERMAPFGSDTAAP